MDKHKGHVQPRKPEGLAAKILEGMQEAVRKAIEEHTKLGRDVREVQSSGSMLSPYAFIEKIKALPFVNAVYLYGSRARGDNVERSDIDLAVDCKGASERDWLRVLDIVEEADTLLQIDCVRLDTLQDEELRAHILRDRKRL